ncbi:restriction endonuclease [Ktedonobacteria bacterium brp13]|nr:restriction endonuclease [Ktedonobacteria bacterium brp13]
MLQKPVDSILSLSHQQIVEQLQAIASRHLPVSGNQVSFNGVETMLCYGLFYILNPHRYGGRNIDKLPKDAKKLADFFGRPYGSITNKMLNLDGSRLHSAKAEPQLFAALAEDSTLYPIIYKDIFTIARTLDIGDERLPDFLGYFKNQAEFADLAGQDDLPATTGLLLGDAENEMKELEKTFDLDERQTEKLALHKVRLAQHRFAVHVLENCGRICVFCGFEPRSLPQNSGLLRASHIKPWAASTHKERVDVQNGLAACPIHDAAFDQGYLTVDSDYHIHRAIVLSNSLAHDRRSSIYFDELLYATLRLPANAEKPHPTYLAYHREHIFIK